MGQSAGSLREEHGTTLAELAVTLAIFAMVMLGVVGVWSKAQESYFIGSEVAETQQNARAAMDFMVREIRSAGRDYTLCAFDFDNGAGGFDCTSGKVDRCDGVAAGSTNRVAANYPNSNAPDGTGTGCQGIFAIPVADAEVSKIRIRADRNDTGTVVGIPNADPSDPADEDVTYELATTGCPSGVDQCITRTDAGGGTVAMVAVDVSGFTLTYYPRPNTVDCVAGTAPYPCQPYTLPLTQAQADNVGLIHIQVITQQTSAGARVTRTLETDVVLNNRKL